MCRGDGDRAVKLWRGAKGYERIAQGDDFSLSTEQGKNPRDQPAIRTVSSLLSSNRPNGDGSQQVKVVGDAEKPIGPLAPFRKYSGSLVNLRRGNERPVTAVR